MALKARALGARRSCLRRAGSAPRRSRARSRPARPRRTARPRPRTRPRPCRRWCTRAGRPSRCSSSGPARSVGHHLQLLDHARGSSSCRCGSMKSANVSPSRRSLREALGQALDDLGHALRRHGADGQAVGAAVVRPLPADDELEVRHAAAADVAAHAEEAEVGDVVLAARVEAAARLDVQVLGVRVAVDARSRASCLRQLARRARATTRCRACRCRCPGTP